MRNLLLGLGLVVALNGAAIYLLSRALDGAADVAAVLLEQDGGQE